MISLEEEIVFYQVGQGIQAETDLLDQFSQLDNVSQRKQLFAIEFALHRLKPTDADIDQALASYDPEDTSMPLLMLHSNQLKRRKGMYDTGHDLGVYYKFLIRVFKQTYHRQYAVEKDAPTVWWYEDLSNPETVQRTLDSYQALIESVYTNASFRTEFTTIARLWHERILLRKAKFQSQNPEPSANAAFTFLTHDELATFVSEWIDDRNAVPIRILRQSVEKALAKMHHLGPEDASRLTLTVIERHLKETYNTDLF